MVATLIKHEFRRTLRWFLLIILGGALVVGTATLMAVLLPPPLNALFATIAAFGCGILLGGVPLWLGIEFYRSSYSKTGYLTRALPIKGSTIYWVKLAHAYLLSLLALVVALALAYVTAMGFAHVAGGSVADVHAGIAGGVELVRASVSGWVMAGTVVLVLLWPLTWLASYFFAAAVGSEGWASKLGLGGPILVWFLYYTASQIVGVLGIFIPLLVAFEGGKLRLLTEMIDFADLSGQTESMPVGVFLTMVLLAVVAVCWAAVSFDRKAELR